TVRTPRRDLVTTPFSFSLGTKRSDCEAVGFIAKDGAINAWTMGGGAAAARFSRGMAGPHLARGSEGVRKAIAAGEPGSWAVSADENVTWGLVVDLVLSVNDPGDAGAPPKTRDVVLLTKTPTPGRRVDEVD